MHSEEFGPAFDCYTFAQNWVDTAPELQEPASNGAQKASIIGIFARLAQQEMETDLLSSDHTLAKAAEDLKIFQKDNNSEKAKDVVNLFCKHLKSHVENQNKEKSLGKVKQILAMSCLAEDLGREEIERKLAVFFLEDDKVLQKGAKDPQIALEDVDIKLLEVINEAVSKLDCWVEVGDDEEFRRAIINLFQQALNGTSQNAVSHFISLIGRIGMTFMGYVISIPDLKNLIDFTISQYHQLRGRRAEYLHLQMEVDKKKALIAAKEQATQLVDSLLESSLKPSHVDVKEWTTGISSEVREQLAALFTPMILAFNENQNPQECHRIASEVALKVAPLIYRKGSYPYEKLSAFFKYQLSRNAEEILKNAAAFYADTIAEDKNLLRKENEPFIDFKQVGREEFLKKNDPLQRFLTAGQIGDICNRALNGPREESPSLESLVQDLSSYENAVRGIDLLVKKYKEVRERRSELLEKQKTNNQQYQSELKGKIDEIRKRNNELILKDRESPFIVQKGRPHISFRDLEEIEGGRYIGTKFLELIRAVERRAWVKLEWEKAIEELLIKGANGIQEGSTSPMEHFLQAILHISSSASLEIPEEEIKALVDEAFARYIKIKADRDLLPELKKRTASARGISQRWVSALSRVQPHDHQDEGLRITPQHVRVNGWALRHFARVAPGKASTVQNTMMLHSTHQASDQTSYFRQELKAPKNEMMNLLKDNALMLLDQGDKIKKDEVLFFNNPNLRKTLELQNEYVDLNTLSDEAVIAHINRVCDQIDKSESQINQFLFVFNLKPLTSKPTKEIGDKLVARAEHLKGLIKRVLESRALGEHRKLANYYSRIVLAGITELDPPFIFAPRLDEANMFNNSILDASIIQQGFTPTMQNVVRVIAKSTPFAKIKPSGVGVAERPDYRFYVESLSELCESPIFKRFKEMGKSAIAKEAGVDFLIDATVQLVESLNDKNSTLMSRFKRTGEISTLRESFGLVLAAMDEANSFKLGVLNRDIADFARIKEHVMDQVLMWLDDPLPGQSEVSKNILMQKRVELEKLITKAQYGDALVPDFCQFTAGGMNSLSNIIRGLMTVKGKEALSVGSFSNCYYETSMAFRNIEMSGKIVSGEIDALNYLDDVKEMISRIKNKPARMSELKNKIAEIKTQIASADANHSEQVKQMKKALEEAEEELNEVIKIPNALDAFFVDLHPSPWETGYVIKANDIKEVTRLILESGIASPIFTLITDSTISELYSREINEVILEYKGKINIAVFNSCQKFESMGSDRLTGGFFSLFTKDKKFLDVFENFKKNDTVEKFNVDGFIHLYRNLPDKLAAHRKIIFDNTELLYRYLDPKFIYNGSSNQKAFISRKEDKENYYLMIFIKGVDLDASRLCENLHKSFLEEGIPLINRQSFGFVITTADGIGNHIRIKVGHGNPQLIKKQASLIEKFFLDICKQLAYDPLV